MRAINNWENIKESNGFEKLPVGGYIIKILNVQDLAELFDVHIPEKLLKCIYYRIPTQLKSFIMPCMITEFTLPGSGDASAYPLILTVINDSDFKQYWSL